MGATDVGGGWGGTPADSDPDVDGGDGPAAAGTDSAPHHHDVAMMAQSHCGLRHYHPLIHSHSKSSSWSIRPAQTPVP
jgi:hypothetical protein